MTIRFPAIDDRAPDRAVLGVARSVTGRRWRDRLDAVGEARALAITQRTGIDQMVARIMAGRDVGLEAAVGFLEPTVRALMPDPSVMTAMDAAAARIADAVLAGEAIALFGDYDVDGATSCALATRYLAALGVRSTVYIPDRLIEGYGPNVEAIRGLAKGGARLLITLDCGSTSFEPLEEARRLGLDTVVIDHHQCDVALPPAVAVVNPNRQDDLSGLGHLAAVGVTFMTMVAVNRELRRRGAFAKRAEPDLMALLDLVALGTVADVVPLIGLNRAFVVRGLAVARSRRNVGLAALATVARLNGPIASSHLGYLIGPRINAGGRIGNAALGAELLATEDPVAAERLAAELDRLNRERQVIETAMLEEAVAEVDAMGDPGPVIVTASETWHPGVVGLIASRLKERWRRPAFAIAFDRGPVGTGSGRSIGGVDLGAAVRSAVAAGLLVKGGGHAMAAGLTIERDRLEAFRAHVEARVADAVADSLAVSDLVLDGVLSASGATVGFVEMVEKAGPYGAGHPEPVFALAAHRVTYVETVGQGHVRASLAAGDGTTLKAMAFRAASEPLGRALLEARGRMIHVAGSLSLDHWQGDARVQLRVLDVALPTGPGL
ncbi:single-stranded-DNA-specific exonuclease RecJ [Prosthecodimorpha staleyi]|uniref:Single-stranded-DNA-specific exonuclease RecJ n=1 Tax=Prosthecodimorpha staleyi TaxID=2840188 RepID=A0A947GAU9_9HYPH|nr:single-stranded-DNA-specific exonuclease RecJ [Prosthecodimorpha staleyi]MBT9288017.1 single-stranded-DNA-specific exonuclease RecJ [Prosthecodimorpha staleyi]